MRTKWDAPFKLPTIREKFWIIAGFPPLGPCMRAGNVWGKDFFCFGDAPIVLLARCLAHFSANLRRWIFWRRTR